MDKLPFRRKRAHHQPVAAGLALREVQGNEDHFAIPDRQRPDSGWSQEAENTAEEPK